MQRLIVDPQQIQGKQVTLTPQQQHYLYRVLRLGSGDRAIVMDGRGKAWIAALQNQEAQLLEPLPAFAELPIVVTLIAALPKGNGFDSVVRSGTELGVATFVPVLSDRALLNPSANKLERWRRIAREAAEQSERAVVPTIVEPVRFPSPDLPDDLQDSAHRYICVARAISPSLLSCLCEQEQPDGGIAIATGPEGGWTEAEVDRAIAQGFQPVSLGPRILRAVTAPLVALALIAAVLGGKD